MKKLIVGVLALGLIVSLSACKSKAKKMSEATKLIPQGATVVGDVNISDLLKIEKIKKEVEKESKKFTKETGLKASDLKRVTFYSTAASMKDLRKESGFAMIVEGNNLNADLFKKLGKKFKEAKHEGASLYESRKVSLSLLGKTLAVSPKAADLKKVIDVSKGKAKAADMKQFSEVLGKLNMSSARVAMVIPETAKKDITKMKSPMPVAGLDDTLKAMTHFAMGADVSASAIKLKVLVKANAKAVKSLAEGLNGMLAMVSMQIEQFEKKMPGAKDAYDSLKIEADGDYLVVSVKIPSKILEKM